MNFANMTTAQIVAAHNAAADALGEKPVNRFADRKTAERRTAAIQARFDKAAAEFAAEQAAKAKAAARAAADKVRAHSPSARDAISASWKDPAVRADRLTRVGVRVVDGKDVREFKSMAKALNAFGLGLKKLIPLRMEMKAAGSVEFAGKKFVAVF